MADQPPDFETLLQRCADKAYNFAFRLAGNDADAQDLVQEAFAKAFQHKDRYDPTRPLEAWVMRILKNVFLDGVRRYETKHKVSMDAEMPSEDGGSWSDILPGKDPEPVTEMIRSEEEARLQKALNAIPVHYRTAVVLYDLEGLSYDEIAKLMECPLGTVCSRIYQGRLLLKKILEKLDSPPGKLVKQ